MSIASPPPDAFASQADKLRFLLQAPDDSAVLLQGGYWHSQRADFSAAGFRVLADLAQSSGQPCLLFLDTRDGIDLLPELPMGSLGGAVAVGRVPRVGGDRYLNKVTERLRDTGLEESARFEVSTLTSRMDELRRLTPSGPRTTSHGLLSRLQAFRHGYLPHVSFFRPTARPELPGLQLAEIEAGRAAGMEPPLRTTNIWFRRRGALVIRLETGIEDGTLFLRVATNAEVDMVLSGNQSFVDQLLATSVLSEEIRRLIPRQFGHWSSGGGELYLESGFSGHMGWTLEDDPELRRRIDRELYQFSSGLQKGAGHREQLSSERVARWLTDFLGPLPERLKAMGLEDAIMDRVANQIHQLLVDRTWWLAPAHGDFGSGNALVRSDGQLAGIIDWDTHAENDLAGIDWCDHRIKSLRFENRDMPGRLGQMIEEAVESGMLAPAHGGFGREDVGLDRSAMVLIPCLAYLRILIREANYPSGLHREPGAYRRLLAMVGWHLSAAPKPGKT